MGVLTVNLRICALFCAILSGLSMLAGCGEQKSAVPVSGDKLVLYSGLPPVAFIAGEVGGGRVDSRSLLPEGRSPHDYSPGPREIRGASASKLFFTTGMPFEKAVSRPLSEGKVRIVDVSRGIERLPLDGAGCNDPSHRHEHEAESEDGLDPHVWLAADNAKIIAKNVADTLSEVDPKGAGTYAENLKAFNRKMDETGEYVKRTLAPWQGREFYVYHPAFGYFGHMAGLKQVAVELDGREATPAHLKELIRRAREHQVKVVFVQPQFNPASARALAKAIDGEVAGLDALAADLPGNMRKMADILKQGFSGGKAQ